jgi:thioredoxin-related protein
LAFREENSWKQGYFHPNSCNKALKYVGTNKYKKSKTKENQTCKTAEEV